MPSQHKFPPISLRLPEADRSWVLAEAERTGHAVNHILAEAVEEYRKANETRNRSDTPAQTR